MLLTRAPVAGGDKQAYLPAAPRLACVKPVASVHPEPGSNSSLFILLLLFLKGVVVSVATLRSAATSRSDRLAEEPDRNRSE